MHTITEFYGKIFTVFTASFETLTTIVLNKHDEKPTTMMNITSRPLFAMQLENTKKQRKQKPMKINWKTKKYIPYTIDEMHIRTSTILISAFSSFVFLLLYFEMNLICQVLICSIHFIFKYGLFHLRENGTAAQKECAHGSFFAVCVCGCAQQAEPTMLML